MKITISLDDEDLQEFADIIAEKVSANMAGADEEAAPVKPKKESAAAKKKAAAAKKAAAEDEDDGEDADDNEDDGEDAGDDGPTRDEVRKALKDYAAIEGKEAAIKILNDNGAKSMGELDAKKFQDVLDACDD